MNSRINNLISKFDQRALKLRLLITLAMIFFIWFFIDSLWISNLSKESKQVNNKIVNLNKNFQQLSNDLNLINQGVKNKKNNPLYKDLKEVNKQLDQIKKGLESKTVNLIKPEEMSGVIKEVMNKSNKLVLLSLNKVPAEAVFKEDNKQDIQMYRHVIEIIFKGKYKDTLIFIKELEMMPKKVNFESINYQVEEHPWSNITLVISTLSLNKKWIGG